jgi:hypothetical protein
VTDRQTRGEPAGLAFPLRSHLGRGAHHQSRARSHHASTPPAGTGISFSTRTRKGTTTSGSSNSSSGGSSISSGSGSFSESGRGMNRCDPDPAGPVFNVKKNGESAMLSEWRLCSREGL